MKTLVAGIALWMAGVAGPSAKAQQYLISTYAGGGPLPLQARGTDLSIDWKSKGLATDSGGNLYFTSLNSVFKVGPDGSLVRIAGNGRAGYSGDGGPATDAGFSMDQRVDSPPYLGSLPPGLAVDNAGNVYVADNGNSRIRKISVYGVVTTVAGTGAIGFSGDSGPAADAKLSSVLGLAVDSAGNLLLADSDNHRVRLITSDGTITTVAGNGVCGSSGDGGPAATAQLCNPTGIALDNAGNLFIAEAGTGRIRRISPDGTISTVTKAISEPTNVSVDASGNLFVVGDDGDFWESWQAVRRISPDGTITFVAGHACEPLTSYCQPSPDDGTSAVTTFLSDRLSTAVDATGNLLVASPGNRRIYRVLADGRISSYAGNGEYDFSGDGGPAINARLASPGSLAVDRDGNLFIVDYFNSRVRKVSPDGIITTVAGNGTWGASGDGGSATDAALAPISAAVDGNADLFIGNDLGGVRKVTPDGLIANVSSIRGPAAVDAQGNLFVADIHLGWVSGLAVDDAGNVYIAASAQVRRLSPDGGIATVAGNGVPGFSGDGGLAIAAQVNPTGVAIDHAGNLFIADGGNSRIRKVSSDGIIATIAGNGARDYSGDGGPATDAAISEPVSVVVDGAGNIYFSDATHNVIRVLRARK
jgi:sugar lactone lactonase YvrE